MVRFTKDTKNFSNFSCLTPDFRSTFEGNSLAVKAELTTRLPKHLIDFEPLYSFGVTLFEQQSMTVAHYAFIHLGYSLLLSKNSYETPRKDTGGGRPASEYEMSLFIKNPDCFTKLIENLREPEKIKSIESLSKTIGLNSEQNSDVHFTLGSVNFTISSFIILPFISPTGVLPVNCMLKCTRHRILPIGIPLLATATYDGNPTVESYQFAHHDIGHGEDFGCVQGIFDSFPFKENDEYFQTRKERLQKTLEQLQSLTVFFDEFYDRITQLSKLKGQQAAQNALWVISHEFSIIRDTIVRESISFQDFLSRIRNAYKNHFHTDFSFNDLTNLVAPVLLGDILPEDEAELRTQCLTSFQNGLTAIEHRERMS